MGFFGRTSKRLGHARFAALAMAVAIAPACHYFGDDESGSSIGASVFAGVWTGTLRVASDSSPFWDGVACTLPAPCIRDMQWYFDTNSMVTDVTVDGSTTNLTGSIAFEAGGHTFPFFKFYDFELSDGTTTETGSFYVEERIRYGIVIDSYGDFATLKKKDIPTKPTFVNRDIRKVRTTATAGVYIRWTGVSEIDEIGKFEIRTARTQKPTGEILYETPIDESERDVLDSTATGYFTNFSNEGIWEGFDIPGPGDPDPDPYPMITIIGWEKDFVGGLECTNFPECVFTIWEVKTY